jgi:hypothetical protein
LTLRNTLRATLVAALLLVAAGCATVPAVGRGGTIYQITVASVNGYPTSVKGGSVSYPACVIQVGSQVRQVWLAAPSRGDIASPVVMEGDEEALKAGILIERSWQEAVVHHVTDSELRAGAAVVYVPSYRKHTVVELRFVPRARQNASQSQNDFAEHRPRL